MENKEIEVTVLKKNEPISVVNKTATAVKSETKKQTSLFSSIKSFLGFSNSETATMQKTEKPQEVAINEEDVSLKTSSNNGAEKSGFLTKFFKNKQAKIAIVVLIFAVCALIILNSSLGTSLTKTNGKSDSNLTFMSSLEYCEKLENKLTQVLSKISGVGNVKIMITVSSAPELIIAESSDEKTNTNTNGTGSTTSSTTSKNPIIVTNSGINSPLILTEKVPEVTGVVVVAEGAKDVKIKLSLLEAVQALLNVKSSNIQIFY